MLHVAPRSLDPMLTQANTVSSGPLSHVRTTKTLAAELLRGVGGLLLDRRAQGKDLGTPRVLGFRV